MLVDTSVWVDHLRKRNPSLVALLEATEVSTHAFVIGELACGNLSRRAELLGHLQALPQTPVIEHAEVLGFVEARKLSGRGIGWVDMHLLASAAVAREPLWTLDKRLARVVRELGLGG